MLQITRAVRRQRFIQVDVHLQFLLGLTDEAQQIIGRQQEHGEHQKGEAHDDNRCRRHALVPADRTKRLLYQVCGFAQHSIITRLKLPRPLSFSPERRQPVVHVSG